MPSQRLYSPIVKNDESGLYETIIGERKYEFSKWGAELSSQTLLQLGGLLGDTLETIAAGVGTGGQHAGIDFMFQVFSSAFTKMSKDVELTMALLKRLCCQGVWCDGKQLSPKLYDHHFEDRLEEVIPVASAAFEVQYKSFFVGIGGYLKGSAPAAPSRPSRETQTA